jgi:hypothetical protein
MKLHLNTILLIAVIGLVLFVNGRHNTRVTDGSDTNVIVVNQEDERLREPRRFYDSRYHPRRAMAINVPTRGEPPEYQQMGYLSGANDSNNIKPLYGRQTYPGSNQWNYFTSLDSHLATKIPITINSQDCTDERGCKELYKNDTVDINGQNYTSHIYGTIAPRYIPY